jgi:hypothetical protein
MILKTILVTLLITYFCCIFIGMLNCSVLHRLLTPLMKETLRLIRQHLLGIKFNRRNKKEYVKFKVGRTSVTVGMHRMKNCSAFFCQLFQVNLHGTQKLSCFWYNSDTICEEFCLYRAEFGEFQLLLVPTFRWLICGYKCGEK